MDTGLVWLTTMGTAGLLESEVGIEMGVGAVGCGDVAAIVGGWAEGRVGTITAGTERLDGASREACCRVPFVWSITGTPFWRFSGWEDVSRGSGGDESEIA